MTVEYQFKEELRKNIVEEQKGKLKNMYQSKLRKKTKISDKELVKLHSKYITNIKAQREFEKCNKDQDMTQLKQDFFDNKVQQYHLEQMLKINEVQLEKKDKKLTEIKNKFSELCAFLHEKAESKISSAKELKNILKEKITSEIKYFNDCTSEDNKKKQHLNKNIKHNM